MKPMLLSNDEYNVEELDYKYMYQSKKRDGVRSETTNQGIKNRSLKILRNIKIQNYFKPLCSCIPNDVILEGEIYSHGILCSDMAGVCNSKDKDVPKGTKLYIFGIYDSDKNFEERMVMLDDVIKKLPKLDCYQVVKQHKVNSAKEAMDFYDQCIKDGYEGAVLMDGSKQYKNGRVTINQHIGFKIKPEREDDLEINWS